MRLACLCLVVFALGCQSATAPESPEPGCTLRLDWLASFEPFVVVRIDQCFAVCPPNAQALADSLKRELVRHTPCAPPSP